MHSLEGTDLAGAETSMEDLAAAWQNQGGWEGWLGGEQLGTELPDLEAMVRTLLVFGALVIERDCCVLGPPP